MANSETGNPQLIDLARHKIVAGVRTPLGFFALALLIVEGFLLGAGIFFELSQAVRVVELGVGVVLFLIVIFIVLHLVKHYPKHLVFSEDAHVAAMQVFGDNLHPVNRTELEGYTNVSPSLPPTGQPTLPATESPNSLPEGQS